MLFSGWLKIFTFEKQKVKFPFNRWTMKSETCPMSNLYFDKHFGHLLRAIGCIFTISAICIIFPNTFIALRWPEGLTKEKKCELEHDVTKRSIFNMFLKHLNKHFYIFRSDEVKYNVIFTLGPIIMEIFCHFCIKNCQFFELLPESLLKLFQ